MSSECVYFIRDEVVVHNTRDDIWVIVNGRVFDLTNLIEKRLVTMNDNLLLLIQYAGKDLSSYFNAQGEPLTRVNQHIQTVPVFPPALEKESETSEFWWCDTSNIIGKITCIERRVRIINTLTRNIITMAVCEEDSIEKIKLKFTSRFNRDADKYIWRKTHSQDVNSGHLFMDKNLTHNGILYDKNEKQGLPPALWLFYVLNKD